MKATFSFISILCILFVAGTLNGQEVKLNSDFVIEADGTMKFTNGATVFDDMMVYPDATTKSGSNMPVWGRFMQNGSSQGVFLLWFSATSEQEVYFCMQIPHSYKVGSTLYPHVHWTTLSDTPTRTNVKWGLEYSVIAIGGTYPTTTTVTGNSIISAITNIHDTEQHLITSLGTISGSGLDISTILVCRFYRDADDGSDTFTGTAGLLGIDFHFEKDTEGSRNEFTK